MQTNGELFGERERRRMQLQLPRLLEKGIYPELLKLLRHLEECTDPILEGINWAAHQCYHFIKILYLRPQKIDLTIQNFYI